MQTERDTELELTRSYAKRLMAIVQEMREEMESISNKEFYYRMHSMADYTESAVNDTCLLDREVFRTSEEVKEDEETVKDDQDYQSQIASYYRATRL